MSIPGWNLCDGADLFEPRALAGQSVMEAVREGDGLAMAREAKFKRGENLAGVTHLDDVRTLLRSSTRYPLVDENRITQTATRDRYYGESLQCWGPRSLSNLEIHPLPPSGRTSARDRVQGH